LQERREGLLRNVSARQTDLLFGDSPDSSVQDREKRHNQ
jgi:hypothetical protein